MTCGGQSLPRNRTNPGGQPGFAVFCSLRERVPIPLAERAKHYYAAFFANRLRATNPPPTTNPPNTTREIGSGTAAATGASIPT